MAKRKTGRSWKDTLDPAAEQARATEMKLHAQIMRETTEGDQVGDLRLGPLEYRAPAELSPSPYNAPFESLKDPAYWEALRRDIADAGTITDPLVVLPDGEIVSGHSRQRVALDLLSEGRQEFAKIPVRVVLSDLSAEDLRKRVYLGNLSRFEIDPDTRLALYSAIYPDYFLHEATGRPQKGDTVSPSRSEVAQAMGLSERHLKREKAIYRTAAEQTGKAEPSPEDLKAARQIRNAQRRKAPAPEPRAPADDMEVIDSIDLDEGPPVSEGAGWIYVDGVPVIRIVDTAPLGEDFTARLVDWLRDFIKGEV